MKKFLAIVLAAILAVAALALAACGGNKGGDTPAGSGDASAPAKPGPACISGTQSSSTRKYIMSMSHGMINPTVWEAAS